MTFSKRNLPIPTKLCYCDELADAQVIRDPSSSDSDVVVSPLLQDELQDEVLLDDDDDDEEEQSSSSSSSSSSSDSCSKPRPMVLFDSLFVVDDVC